ncbi:metalloprotease TldD [Amorphus orientalis]|uniref:TldD protein n=1 Tax=Amorphus orientalis TaxID=649198 RepID=A0AAE3VRA4_9HYPH|nr:metalloprotease TldD [Amorphus orientalis]MDQ0316718.1 TldD protein [Amorphus orientalis]
MTEHDLDLIASAGLSPDRVGTLVGDAVAGSDDGELFLEYRQSESLVFDNGRLKAANFDTAHGFGLRAVAGEAVGYAHSGEISEAALKRASAAVQQVKKGYAGASYAAAPPGTNARLYEPANPLSAPGFEEKVKLLERIDAAARARDPRVRQVTVSLAGSWQVVEILRGDGHRVRDVRPLVRLNVAVVAGDGDRQESGSYGIGGREGFGRFIAEDKWQHAIDEALRQALVNLEAVPAPAGTFDVVLGAGWPGILLHEAVGHGLEGDFNRRKSSAFADMMGEKVASEGVTIVDDGTLHARRGSLTVDDEGTPAHETTLIEDGRLVGYMQDRQNARLMGMVPTGNGRRESYAHVPMPRMTNTYMRGGDHDPGEILGSLMDGLYMVSFGGGQVDITSGKFVFSSTEAYRVRDGKIGEPVKGAMLIGNGPDALTRVRMVGSDMALDPGIGTCGKQGQGVPVGVGQPTIRIDGLTVGGTEA